MQIIDLVTAAQYLALALGILLVVACAVGPALVDALPERDHPARPRPWRDAPTTPALDRTQHGLAA